MRTPKGGGIGIFFVFPVSAVVVGLPHSFWLPIGIMAVVAFWGIRSGGRVAGFIWMAAKSLLNFICMASFLFPFYVDVAGDRIISARKSSPQEHEEHEDSLKKTL